MSQIEKDNKNAFGSYVQTLLHGVPIKALVDSGNLWRSAISDTLAKQLGFPLQQLRELPVTTIHTAKEGTELTILGELPHAVKLQIGSCPQLFKLKPVVIQGLSMPFNISGPFLQANQIDLLNTRGCLRIQGKEVKLLTNGGQEVVISSQPKEDQKDDQSKPCLAPVYVASKVKVPPYSWATFPLKVPQLLDMPGMVATMGHLRGDDHFMALTDLHPYRRQQVEILADGWTRGAALNTTDEEKVIQPGTKYGLVSMMPMKNDNDQVQEWTEAQKDEWLVKEFRLNENPLLQSNRRMQALLQVLKQYWKVYSTDGTYGKTTLLKHEIHTEPGPPVNMRFRPLNPTVENALREQVQDWLQHDVIEPSTSPWSFALVAVKKKNGQFRFCLDYRKLNSLSRRDQHPLPHIEDNLARLADSRLFSALDGMGAFHVVELADEAKPKTAFATPWGLYQFKRMPFGLSNGPATYSRLMQLALQGIPTTMCLPYLDDVIVHSKTFSQHLDNLARVLEAHEKAGLKLQPSKCHLLQEETQYLGHLVSAAGIRPVPAYLEAVKDWPLPRTLTQVRAFLGKVSYYRRFIPQFAALAKPWTDAIKQDTDTDEGQKENHVKHSKDRDITVTASMETAFTALKNKLLSAPILAYPRFDEDSQFILDTDWSADTGTIGAVLSQVQNGEEKVICYGAKKLSKSQANYPSSKGELFAVIYFMKYWRYYLQYRPFLLRTDNKALTWIRTMDQPTGMVMRWLETLAAFDFQVQHRAGVDHGNADGLSRIEHAKPIDESEGSEELMSIHSLAVPREGTKVVSALLTFLANLRQDKQQLPQSNEEWVKEQRLDPDLGQVYDWTLQDTWPNKEEIRGHSPVRRQYYAQKEQLWVSKEGLLRLSNPQLPEATSGVICVPEDLQDEVIKVTHLTCGHKGITATLHQLELQVYFPAMQKRISEVLRSCLVCQRKGDQLTPQKHTLAQSVVGFPFQKLSIDFVGPLPPSNKRNTWLLTIKDVFTRWMEAFPIRQANAANVAIVLEKEIFSRYGYPETIHSDRGTPFTSTLMKQVSDLTEIRLTQTPAYNPKSNAVERAHRDLKAGLRAIMDDLKCDWEEALPHVLFAMRTTVCRQTGFTPFRLMFGREARIPLLALEPLPERKEEEDMLDYVRKYQKRIQETHQLARDHLQEAVQRQRTYYDRALKEYHEGDHVWLYTPPSGVGVSRKFYQGWTGPWEVLDKPTVTTCLITSRELEKTMMVTIDRLKPYYTPRDRDQRDLLPQELSWNEGVEDVPPGPIRPAGAPPEDDSDGEEPGTPRWRPVIPPRGGGVVPPVPPRPLRVLPRAVRPPPRDEPGDVYEAYGDNHPVVPAAARRTRIPGPQGARWPPRRRGLPQPPSTIPRDRTAGGRPPEGRGDVTQRLQRYCDEPTRNISQEPAPHLVSPRPSTQASATVHDSSDGDDEDEGDGGGARAAPVPLALRRLQDSEGWANAPAHRK